MFKVTKLQIQRPKLEGRRKRIVVICFVVLAVYFALTIPLIICTATGSDLFGLSCGRFFLMMCVLAVVLVFPAAIIAIKVSNPLEIEAETQGKPVVDFADLIAPPTPLVPTESGNEKNNTKG